MMTQIERNGGSTDHSFQRVMESVDYDALMRMVDYLLQNNADFLCVLGTTAETPTLTEEERNHKKKGGNRPALMEEFLSVGGRW